MNRRQFLLSAAAPVLLPACASGKGSDYEKAARATWRHGTGNPVGLHARQSELVRYATLAPSSHNTQCWQFKLGANRISILPDRSRRCPAVDPDNHHLYVSLGCAAENLAQAANAAGLHSEITFDAAADAVNIDLSPAPLLRSVLFEAIPQRQCTRSDYDGRIIPTAELKLLEQQASGNGVRVILFNGAPQREEILDYVTRGNSAQMADDAFVTELKHWIRFNATDAIASGDGLYAPATGNPALPHWLGPALMSLFYTQGHENDKNARQLRSSSGVAVFVSTQDDKSHWVETGRCYQRFALQATVLGLCNALINQPVEVAALRPQFAAYLGLHGGRPDLVVRFGYGPAMPRSLRRPVDDVLV